MITVEGCDNTGKTTLVTRLCEDFPQLKYHPSIGNKHDLKQIVEQAYYQAEEAEDDEIWDRSRLISEYIYNPILKGRPLAYSYRTYLRLLGIWLDKPQMIIYCRREYSRILQTFQSREQLEGVEANLFNIYIAYDNVMGFLQPLFGESTPPKYLIEYNFDVDKYEDVRDKVGRYLVEAKGLAEGVIV